MTAPIGPIDLSAFTADDLVELADALKVAPGQRSLATRAALFERDRLVRELAARYYPGLCRHQQSVRIHDDLLRYAGGPWVRTRADLECRHRDDRRRLLWQILKTRGGHVPSVRLIEDILASRTS